MPRTLADVRARPSCATCRREYRLGELRVRVTADGREWYCSTCAAGIDAQAPLIPAAELEHHVGGSPDRWARLNALLDGK